MMMSPLLTFFSRETMRFFSSVAPLSALTEKPATLYHRALGARLEALLEQGGEILHIDGGGGGLSGFFEFG